MELKPNKELIELLADIDMFNEMNESEKAEFASLLEIQKYDAGKALFQEGDPGGHMFIIADGTVEVQKKRSHGTGNVVIARFDRGGVIGEMSLVDGLTRSATVMAVQFTHAFVLDNNMFDDMLQNRQTLAIKLLKGLSRLLSLRLRNTSGWFADVF
ncbi:MAG: cyclic nucleotide-binding domain-containing protein [Calditrichota bacterium]